MADGSNPQVLSLNIQSAYTQFVFWTRSMLVSVVSDVKGRPETIEKLKDIPNELYSVFLDHYETDECETLRSLHLDQALLFVEIARAYAYENSDLYELSYERLVQNTEAIAAGFNRANPLNALDQTANYFLRDVQKTIDQIRLRFDGEFVQEITAFDEAYQNIISLAEYLSANIAAKPSDS
ncbi:MAG: hypothetical protein LBT20_00315 [Clostridiales bacterium]|jgi:hypothetical protein|nr:hypothetical protein [Clostridiales bacterium]